MLKKMIFKKIVIASLGLLVLLLFYFFPREQKYELDLLKNQEVEYVYSSNNQVIYLLDSKNYISRTKIPIKTNKKTEQLIKDLIEVMIEDGKKQNIIPNGFKAIIPTGTILNKLSIDDNVVKLDFSKEFLDTTNLYEEKMIEAIVFTITNIDDIKGVMIYIEGELLTKLPHSGKNLPTLLTREIGINKIYDINNVNNIYDSTVYYVGKFNDNYYYTPITKYTNKEQDRIKVIIEELTSGPVYQSNLMSFLNVNTKLTNYEIKEQQANLYFNSYILNDIDKKDILEEVIYTISLSLKNNYDIKTVSFYVDDEKIYDYNE